MVASSKWSLSIWRTRSRTISFNPYQSRFFHVLMLKPVVTVLVSRSALGVCDKTRRRSMTRLYPPKTRSGQKPGSNMHKTITFPYERVASFVKSLHYRGRGTHPIQE